VLCYFHRGHHHHRHVDVSLLKENNNIMARLGSTNNCPKIKIHITEKQQYCTNMARNKFYLLTYLFTYLIYLSTFYFLRHLLVNKDDY